MSEFKSAHAVGIVRRVRSSNDQPLEFIFRPERNDDGPVAEQREPRAGLKRQSSRPAVHLLPAT